MVIAVCSVICQAEGWQDLEEQGKARVPSGNEFQHCLTASPAIIPTCQRALSHLESKPFTRYFISYPALRHLSDNKIVSIDGKTLRHSFDHAAAEAVTHMARA